MEEIPGFTPPGDGRFFQDRDRVPAGYCVSPLINSSISSVCTGAVRNPGPACFCQGLNSINVAIP